MKRITSIVIGMVGFLSGAVLVGRLTSKSSNKWKNMADKNMTHMMLMNQWLMAKQCEKKLEDYFIQNGYKKIIIYGMSFQGERLVDELRDSKIEIVAGVDRNAKAIFSEIPVISPEDMLPDADCMVITPTYFYDDIADKMSAKYTGPIISLEDVIYDA